MKVNILGTEYEIIVKRYDEDETFERESYDGYCDSYNKTIVICEMDTYKGWKHEDKETCRMKEKEILRHEIIHAFYNESGLQSSAFCVDIAWSKNEEMVDWIALQGPKIYEAWKSAGAL